MKKRIYKSAIGLIAVAPLVCNVMASELPMAQVVNGTVGAALLSNTFDENMDGWYVTTAGGAKVDEAEQGRNDGKCVKVTGRTDTWNSLAYNLLGQVENNTTYTFSVWVKLPEGAADTTVKVGLTTKDSTQSVEQYDQFSLTSNTVTASASEWREIKGTFSTAWSGDLEKIEFKVADETSKNDFYVDDIVIDKEGGQQEVEQKILIDNDFEEDLNGAYVTTVGGAEVSITDGGKDGGKCATVVNRTDTWNSFAYDILDQVTNNTEYSFSVWVKLAKGNPETTVKVGLTTKDSTGGAEQYDQQGLTNNTVLASSEEWREIKGTFKTEWSGELEKFELKVADETSLNDFYVDNFKLTAGQSSQAKPTVIPEVQLDIPSLKTVYEDYFSMGVAIPTSLIDSELAFTLIGKHFNSITHENDMKPIAMLGGTATIGADGWPVLNFNTPDAVLDYLLDYNELNKENPIKVRGHVLMWHEQTPEWFFKEDFDASKPYVTKEVMNERLEWYTREVLTHYHGEDSPYKGLIYAWDVINEVINPQDGEHNGLRKTVQFGGSAVPTHYYAIYGNDAQYVTNSFVYANKYAPADVALYYNDYDETNAVKSEYIYNMLKQIQNTEGARIDGMGMQAHYSMDSPSVNDIEIAIRKYASLGLDIQITELDMKVGSGPQGSYEEEAIKQGHHFKDIFNTLKNLKEEGIAITNVTVWGLTDGHSWLSMPQYSMGKEHHPLVFDKNYQAKPAYWGMVDPSKLSPVAKEIEAIQAVETMPSNQKKAFGTATLGGDLAFGFDAEGLRVYLDVKNTTGIQEKVTVYVENSKVENTIKPYDQKIEVDVVENGYIQVPMQGLVAGDELKVDVVISNGQQTVSWSDSNQTQEEQADYYGKVALKSAVTIQKAGEVLDFTNVEAWPLTIQSAGTPTSATAKVLWDEQHLYVQMEVQDSILNKDSVNAYEHDSVEVFIDENFGRTASYESDDAQYRVNYMNEQSFNGVHCKAENIQSTAEQTPTGYRIDMKIKFNTIQPKAGDLIGLDLQVNEADASGTRKATLNWYDNTGIGWASPNAFGIVKLGE